MTDENKKLIGQQPDAYGKCKCDRCGKRLSQVNFYTYRDGSKITICKACLTAHIDNFDKNTFLWVLEKLDIPYVQTEWNVLRDKAFDKDPRKMNGLSVIGKYISKMKLKQWKNYHFADSDKIAQELNLKSEKKSAEEKAELEKYETELKEQLEKGEITEAEYKTLVRTETQKKNLPKQSGNVITGQIAGSPQSTYEAMLGQIKNPFQEQNFLPQSSLVDLGSNLQDDDKIYLAMKWGRLYTPAQWVTLETLYNNFMNSFDIQGAARIDTLKKICKTSLKMDQAIDMGDVDTYQKLSRVYDQMMKSAKFTQAQNKESEGDAFDSVSAIVDFVEAHSGAVPKYQCKQPQDIMDKIIVDLKEYTRSLIYEDKALAQEIEKYLQDKRIADEMKRDKEAARSQGSSVVELSDEDLIDYKNSIAAMKEQDAQLDAQEGVEQK